MTLFRLIIEVAIAYRLLEDCFCGCGDSGTGKECSGWSQNPLIFFAFSFLKFYFIEMSSLIFKVKSAPSQGRQLQLPYSLSELGGKSPALISETDFLSPGTWGLCYAMSLLAKVFGPLVFRAMPFPRRNHGLWVGPGSWIGELMPNEGAKKTQKGGRSLLLHEDETALWQPDGSSAVLLLSWGQIRVRAGGRQGGKTGLASGKDGKRIWVKEPSLETGDTGGCTSIFKSSTPYIYKS